MGENKYEFRSMKIKVNNKYFVEAHNIIKLVEKKNPKCYSCTKT